VVDLRESYLKRVLLHFLLCVVTAAVFTSIGTAPAAGSVQRGEDILLESYHSNLAAMHKSSFGLPLLVTSYEKKDRSHVDVYGIFDYPFGSVADTLKIPANWCDIIGISPNVKACTYGKQVSDGLLNIYVGRKGYRSPEDARRVISRFKVAEQRPGYLNILLAADTGPYGTRNYRMEVEAVPVAAGKTFIHVSFEYSDSAALRMVEKAYYATLGHNKTGFTVIGTDDDGKPVLVGGRRGAIERNTVRYYLAIRSFLTVQRLPAEQRFSRVIGDWYDLVSRYRQLDVGLDRQEYLDTKARERKNQQTLQQRILTTRSEEAPTG
jgi:hypothetical protein